MVVTNIAACLFHWYHRVRTRLGWRTFTASGRGATAPVALETDPVCTGRRRCACSALHFGGVFCKQAVNWRTRSRPTSRHRNWNEVRRSRHSAVWALEVDLRLPGWSLKTMRYPLREGLPASLGIPVRATLDKKPIPVLTDRKLRPSVGLSRPAEFVRRQTP